MCLSTMVFGGASYYAMKSPKDKLLGWGPALYTGILGLIGLQLIGGLSYLAMGPNLFSLILMKADIYVGLGIFTGMVAYDTQLAINQYERGIADHMMTSIQFVLNFWNIFIRLIRAL